MEGWIKIYRKLCQWEWYNISEMVHLFIHLLLNANREPGEWRGVKIERGQILTGLNSLNKETNISFQTLRTCLKRLEKTKEINIQVTNKYSIITICNFESYQNGQQTTNKQPNKQLTSNQQTTNNKQEYKEEKEYIKSFNFYVAEGKKAKEFTDKMSQDYVRLCYHVIQKNEDGSFVLPYVLKIKTQIALKDFAKLYEKSGQNLEKITTKIDSIQSTIKYHNKYDNLYFTINSWFNRDLK